MCYQINKQIDCSFAYQLYGGGNDSGCFSQYKRNGFVRTAPFEFHLTGSRAFGYETKNSDWDFFVGVTDDHLMALRTWLTSSGYIREGHHRYVEPLHGDLHSATEVWTHVGGNVHVQVVRDPATKVAVENAVKAIPEIAVNLGRMDKSARSIVWKAAHAAYDAAKRSAEDPARCCDKFA